jgi:hypothetical protein
MSTTSTTRSTASADQRWVAFGPAGAVGTILREGSEYRVRMLRGDTERGPFPSLEIAKSAVHASLGAGAERPEFREH